MFCLVPARSQSLRAAWFGVHMRVEPHKSISQTPCCTCQLTLSVVPMRRSFNSAVCVLADVELCKCFEQPLVHNVPLRVCRHSDPQQPPPSPSENFIKDHSRKFLASVSTQPYPDPVKGVTATLNADGTSAAVTIEPPDYHGTSTIASYNVAALEVGHGAGLASAVPPQASRHIACASSSCHLYDVRNQQATQTAASLVTLPTSCLTRPKRKIMFAGI